MNTTPYPYAPLRPLEALSRLNLETTNYGIGLGVEAGERPSAKTRRAGDRSDALSTRVLRDILAAEVGPLEAVAR